ncbi:MAG: hypothetical protein PWQ37_121 [Candidatus Petromonas sp.]|jgi:flagellar motility protein MotE (MotC chaperone)|nr:hypothetical protein [Candidatus Petromonas sp.]
MAKNKTDSEKQLGIGKIFLILFTIFILLPILILGIIYSTNDDIKMQMNRYLTKLPGKIGDYFKAYPTKEELSSQVKSIANYLVEIDNDRATDKLTLIKNEDEKLYSDIIKVMLKLNSNKTQTIVESIRRNSIKKDVLVSTLNQIEREKEREVLSKAEFYEKLSPITAIDKIISSLDNGSTSFKDLGVIFENMKEDTAIMLLSNLNEDIRNNILENISSDEKRRNMEALIASIKDRQANLNNIADIYSIESPDKLVNIIGNTQTYVLDELASIYRNMGVLKSAQVLSKVNNDDFVMELINKIKEQEILSTGRDLLTEDILKAMKIYRQFNNNVAEMSSIYEKMDNRQISALIKRLIGNAGTPKKYFLDNGEVITITDEDLALAILKNFDDRKLASVLSFLGDNLSSEISRKLTIPSL